MKQLTVMLGLSLFLFSTALQAQVSEAEVEALRAQIEMLTKRLDELEKRNAATPAPDTVVVVEEERVVPETVVIVEENQQGLAALEERVAAMSWAERLRWKGDFRYRYENIEQEGKDTRNRSRIRARTSLIAEVTDTVEVGVGLATGGDDPVSSNQTIGGGGSSKDVKLDLAYFNWSGLTNTNITGGKFSNFLIRPSKQGLMWDGDWRPEGLGVIWDNDFFFAQGLGTWLEGDSRRGTEFAWTLQAGLKFDTGDWGKLKIGAGYSVFDVAGRTPLFGEADDFFGNTFVFNASGERVFAYNYENIEAFAEWGIGKFTLFADYTINQDAPIDDTGYLFGAKYGSAKDKGQWDFTYFYAKKEKDAMLGLLTDSDFGGGGTDSKGHAFVGTYAFHKQWNFKATYFLNQVDLDDKKDYDRLMLDLNFKF
ncbi:MAG: hypothetical protein HKP19_07905 [Xanthomonadales bacterium]|nr:hypothetical protein [Xanthomonadales bacterium]